MLKVSGNNDTGGESRMVMVVEDDPVIRSILCNIIKRDRPETHIIECVDGQDAVNKMNNKIGLIFTDNNMPILSGLEFIRKIKSDPVYSAIPVVMVSVESREEYKKLGRELGTAGWIVKPFVMSQIQKYIHEYI